MTLTLTHFVRMRELCESNLGITLRPRPWKTTSEYLGHESNPGLPTTALIDYKGEPRLVSTKARLYSGSPSTSSRAPIRVFVRIVTFAAEIYNAQGALSSKPGCSGFVKDAQRRRLQGLCLVANRIKASTYFLDHSSDTPSN